ncbi:unnamed protein product [Aphis gossypii]|uniref:Uncharacterized protein n=1 Tax=Aphis gossypii TaxID=80765 RepID=A0A9P0JAH1_APHGO|nr:unnamed protein product [Aphis gossypii]
MPSKKRKYNARFPAGRIKKIMRIDDEIGKVALPVPGIPRALELFVSSLLVKAGDVTMQKSARTLTLAHLKQCIYSDSRLDFLKELVKSTPDNSEECNDIADSAVTQNNQVSNNDSDDETTPKTIERYLLNGCACRLSTAEYRWMVTLPEEVSGALPSDTISRLSAVRLLLSSRRRRGQLQPAADSNRCPTAERAHLAMVSSTKWFDGLLAAFASDDDHVRYVATCVATEAVLGCADDGDSPTRLIDKLLLTITTTTTMTVTRRSSAAAIDVLTRVLDAKSDDRPISTAGTSFCRHVDGDTAHSFAADAIGLDAVKVLLLDRLHDRWSDVVNANRDDDLPEIVWLWTAVFRSFRSAGPVHRANSDRFYSELPGLEWLLYRADTEPLVWLNAVRLLGAGMQTSGSRPTSRSLAGRALAGFTRRRLLYFMDKMTSAFGRHNSRTTRALLQETVLLAMRSLRAFVADDDGCGADADTVTTIRDVVDCLDSYVKASALYATDVAFCRWSVRLMCDRDDATVECLTCALDVVDAVPAARPLVDPFAGFAELLKCVQYEPEVLLDYLISDESDFLSYALRLLKTACRDALRFFRSFGTGLDDAMGLLIRLRLKMLRLHENRVFPYNVMPIAKLIQRCDELYTEIVS